MPIRGRGRIRVVVIATLMSGIPVLLATGAPSDGSATWWSLRPLERPPVPALSPQESALARTPVDAFVLARQREKGLTLSPPADRRTLIRRVYFDVLGLPPTPPEIEAFVHDPDEDAYEHLVDRLLTSVHLGERWARHWLDVVHYADTHGYDKDKPRPNAWPYRDYVIRSFNADTPYWHFVSEQLAGDVLHPETRDGVVATGFIATGPWDFIGHAEVPETKIDGQIARHLDRDDMVRTAMSSFVSMTAGCARCHDHKFDPVTMEDYYSLQAVFAALDRADRPYEFSVEVARKRAGLLGRQDELVKERSRYEATRRRRAGPELDEIETTIEKLRKDKPADPSVAQKLQKLAAMRTRLLQEATDDTTRERLDGTDRELAMVKNRLERLPPAGTVYAGTVHRGSGSFRGTGHDGGVPRSIHVLARGDVRTPEKLVGPGTVDVIDGVSSRFELPPGHHEGERRRALAAWLVDNRNPLTWRSIVNRIWQYHFGRAIVDSANDFGRMGQLPTHPRLLDWLAVEFRDGGQSIKALHRLFLTSAVYRQSSASSPRSSEIDSSNVLLWRMNRRRLEAEAIRDSVLAVSGALDSTMFGPGFRCFVLEHPEHSPHYEYHKHDPADRETHRRSIYRFIVRSQPDPFMNTLDCADSSQLVGKRNETLTSLQALALLNNGFMLHLATCFARRVEGSAAKIEAQIELAHRLAIGRPPDRDELKDLLTYAKTFGMANACRVILNLNEFLFVD